MKDGAGRFLAAALLVAAVWPASTTRAATETVGTRTDTSGGPAWDGWTTQLWPMHGQRGDQRRFITPDFTIAQFRSFAGTAAWPGVIEDNLGDPIWGEIVTAHVSALSPLGPHGVFTTLFDDRMFIGLTTAAINDYLGIFGYPYTSRVIIGSTCGDYLGSPIIITDDVVELFEGNLGKVSVGYFHVFGLNSCRRLERRTIMTAYFLALVGPPPPIPVVFALEATGEQSTYDLGGDPLYSPVAQDGIIYTAVRRIGPATFNGVYDEHVRLAGLLHAIRAGSIGVPLDLAWTAALQIGAGSTGPLPKGQEPPPAGERYWPVTPAAVRDNLLVIGCEGWSDDFSFGFLRELHLGYALIAYDSQTGTQLWSYKLGSRIMPTPSITAELIIFGTADGRVYALDHNGNQIWATPSSDRVTYRSLPYSTPQQLGQASLHGPAIDQAGDFAYFGGSDGRVHKFSIATGIRESSELLALFREPGNRDANGLQIIRPVRISSAPAIHKNKMLLVKYHTNTQGSFANGSFLAVLNLPDLTFNTDIREGPNVTLDANSAVFRGGGGGTFGAVSLRFVGGLMGYDPLNQINFIDNAGFGLYFPGGDETDSGGVSLADGFAMATDGSGRFVLIPSDDRYTPDDPTGSVRPRPPVAGPEPNPGPPALGPVEAFPNPFMPSRAKGGTFKFRNLPMGSRVEIYTLAFERVKSLQESNYRAEWDATNEAGQPVSTGVYLYKIFLPDDRPPITGRVALTR